MSAPEERKIGRISRLDAEVFLPPSKSYTARALIAAALARGDSEIVSPSLSDDSRLLIGALGAFGVRIEAHPGAVRVHGTDGILRTPTREVNLGNAGTAMRFLSSFAALAPGTTVLTGDTRLTERPIGDLIDALRQGGVRARTRDGFPPVTIEGGSFRGGTITVRVNSSSQFLSSLLLAGPYVETTLSVTTKGKTSSLPYLRMTVDVMRSFGATVEVEEETRYSVGNRARYRGRSYTIEGDASSAAYFFAAAAITRGRVTVRGLPPGTLQGDIAFLEILKRMGCAVGRYEDRIEVSGGALRGVRSDLCSMPDCVPVLAVVAAFAEGESEILNVAHLRFKETDRLLAVKNELTKLGAMVTIREDGLVIHPGRFRPASVATYNDHRIAMSFAVAGLAADGISIQNPSCVSKSFPNFWEEFKKLEGRK